MLSPLLLLLNTWQTPCTPLPKRHSVVISLEITQDDITATTRLFEDKECQRLSLTLKSGGAYRVGEAIGNAFEFDLMAGSTTLVIQNDGVLQHYNTHQICGLSDWKLDEPRDVSGRFCAPNQMPLLGQKALDLFQVESGVLRFGAFPRLPSPPDQRPRQVDSFFAFTLR